MRFIADGPTIPDDLLTARDEGQVVFFCGAGVSRARAELHDFASLALAVADDLGSSVDSAARQFLRLAASQTTIPGVGGLLPTDRVFSLLEREFEVSKVRAAVGRALAYRPSVDVSAHKTILDLARGPNGTIRLVTTNFDRLFEKSDGKAPVYVPPRLPRPDRPQEWSGIVYLHGRLGDAFKAPPEDEEFVLSSTDFGRAYLTDGWATAFIRGLMSRFQIVFLGYAADDPPVQYLLEALGRVSPGRGGLFAFQSGPVEHARAVWASKGVEAISYDGANGHEALWSSLAGWAERARDPEIWHQKVLQNAQLGPAALSSHERGQLKHIVLTPTGARRFSEAKPPAEWLCVFDSSLRYGTPQRETETHEASDPFAEYGLDDDELPSLPDLDNPYKQRSAPSSAWDAFATSSADHAIVRSDNVSSISGFHSIVQPPLLPRLGYLAAWISQISENPIAPWWAAGRGGLHPALCDMIRRGLPKKDAPKAVVDAWQLIFTSEPSRASDFDMKWFDFAGEINSLGWNEVRIRTWGELLRPRISIQKPYGNIKPTPDASSISLRDIVAAEVVYPTDHNNLEVPDEFLNLAAAETRRSLRVARSLHAEISESEYFSIPPVTPDPDVGDEGFSRDYGISRLFFRYVKLLERLGNHSVSALKREVGRWPVEGPIFDHLRMWIAGKATWFSGTEAVQMLRATSDRIFWGADGQRDLLTSLLSRWPDFTTEERDGLVSYLSDGPPPYQGERAEEHQRRRACRALERLEWLRVQGCDLGHVYENARQRLLSDCSDWEESNVLHAAGSMEGRSGFIATDEDPADLVSVPAARVLEVAEERGGRDWDTFTERRPFSGLVKVRPAKAFKSLMLAARAGNYPEWAWEAFFYASERSSDPIRFKRVIASRLCALPPSRIREFIRSIGRWLEEVATELHEAQPREFDDLWDKIISAIQEDPSCCQPSLSRSGRFDWVSLALNSAGGQLAQALMKLGGREIGDRGLRRDWLKKVEDVLSIGGDARRAASAIFLFNINWFYYHERDWSEAHFLSLLSGDDEDIAAFWSGVLWSNRAPPGDLFIKLKPMLLALAQSSEELGNKDQRLAGFLLIGWAGRLRNHKRIVSDGEMRDALVRSGEGFRAHIIWHLQRWSADEPKLWRRRLYRFLREVWPQQKAAKTSKTSSRMFDLAIESGNSFPRLVPLLIPLMTNVDQDAFMLFKAERSEHNLIERFPEAMLDLVFVALSENAQRWPYGADQVVKHLAEQPKIQLDDRLVELRRRLAAR